MLSTRQISTIFLCLAASVFAASTASKAFAAGSYGMRIIKTNNIYQCKGNALEVKLDVGNAYSARSEVTLICLESPQKARWVLKAAAECHLDPKPGTCKNEKLNLSLRESVEYSNSSSDIHSSQPHIYEARKSVVGTDCVRVVKDGNPFWRCKKYTDKGSLKIQTTGNTKLIWLGKFDEMTKTNFSTVPFDFLNLNEARYTSVP